MAPFEPGIQATRYEDQHTRLAGDRPNPDPTLLVLGAGPDRDGRLAPIGRNGPDRVGGLRVRVMGGHVHQSPTVSRPGQVVDVAACTNGAVLAAGTGNHQYGRAHRIVRDGRGPRGHGYPGAVRRPGEVGEMEVRCEQRRDLTAVDCDDVESVPLPSLAVDVRVITLLLAAFVVLVGLVRSEESQRSTVRGPGEQRDRAFPYDDWYGLASRHRRTYSPMTPGSARSDAMASRDPSGDQRGWPLARSCVHCRAGSEPSVAATHTALSSCSRHGRTAPPPTRRSGRPATGGPLGVASTR